MNRFVRVMCILPLILLILNVMLSYVPLELRVERRGSDFYMYYGNFVSDYHIDTIITILFVSSIIYIAIWTVKGEGNAWEKAKKKS